MNSLRITPLLILLALAAMLAVGLWVHTPPEVNSPILVGQRLPLFRVQSLDGKTFFAPDLWRDRVAALNVFASWCEPCAAENPVMMKLAAKVPIYGLAWRDHPAAVSQWLSAHGNPYQAVGVDEHSDTTILLALSGVPETFIVDKKGRIAMQYKAPITDELLNTTILPLIEKLENER